MYRSAFPLAWLVVLFILPQPTAAEVYFVEGYHGGYYLTPEAQYQEALDRLFDVLDRYPQFKVVFELEPYTLQRMKGGEKFACERFKRDTPTLAAWGLGGQGEYDVRVAAGAARSGKYGLRVVFRGGGYAHALASLKAEEFRGRTLVFSGWIRQPRGRGAHLYVDAWDEHRLLPGSTARTLPVPADAGWHRVEMRWRVPEGALRILPQAKCDGEPTEADFDDLSLKVVETGKELLANGGFEKVAEPVLRDEARLEKLRTLVRHGQVEIVGGAYTQPILYAIGDESALRQFVYGLRAVERSMGSPVRIYAAQEPGMCSQLPQILSQAGFESVLYRTIWGIFGAPPHRDCLSVAWVGSDGSKIQAVPSYAVFERPRYGLTTHPTRQLLDKLRERGIERPLFGTLDDFLTETIPEAGSPVLAGEFGFGWANLCQRVPAQPLAGREVILSGAIRSRQQGAHLYIDSHDDQDSPLSGRQSANIDPDGRWHRVEVRYRVPQNAAWLFPQGRLIAAAGQADFDALRLTGADGRVLAAGSFETGGLDGFGVGASQGVQVRGEAAAGDAAEGKRFVSLHMRAGSIKARVVTLAEYFQAIGKPRQEWHDAFQGFEFRFPFGLLFGEVQRADRQSEDLLVRTERLTAIAGLDATAATDDAWESHLMGEHHDGWVCAPSIFGIWKHPTYAAMCQAAFDEARRLCTEQLQAAGCLLPGSDGRAHVEGARFAIVNPSGFGRSEMASVTLTLPKAAARRPALWAVSEAGRSAVPSTIRVLSKHDDGSAQRIEASLLVRSLPAMGYARYEVADGQCVPLPQVKVHKGPPAGVDNGLVRVIASTNGVEIAAAGQKPLALLLAGSFPGKGEVRTSIVAGEVRSEDGAGLALGQGRIADVPYRATFKVEPNVPVVRMKLEFDFGRRTEVGAREALNERGLPAHARDDQKLRLVIPLPFAHPAFFSHAPLEVRRVCDERYPVLRYAMAEDGGGITVLPDRATMGVFRRQPAALEMVLAYGGKFIYAPDGVAPLSGKRQCEVGLLPYRDNWETAGVVKWSEVFAQSLAVVRSVRSLGKRQSLVAIEPEGAAVVTAAMLHGNHLVVRLWRPNSGSAQLKLHVPGATKWCRTDFMHHHHNPQANLIRIRQHEFVTLCAEFAILPPAGD